MGTVAGLSSLVLASANQDKLREFTRLLDGVVDTVVAQGELGVKAVAEPHLTFLENALAKARAASGVTGQPALADDSGLCVASLAGAPGVHSARFAGDAGDAANNSLLLERLVGVNNRAAHYQCTLVLCRHAEDPCPLVAEGRWHGTIALTPVGTGGFGYDPLFEVAAGRTAAQMEPAVKDEQSHRGKAVRQLLTLLRARD